MRPLTLNHKTHEGRDVVGIEIATDPFNLADGKPIFANMGTHHAREWPSAEHALEWAYDLLTNYGKQARTTRLVKATRNIVIPVVTRMAQHLARGARLPACDGVRRFSYEMKRKNAGPTRRRRAVRQQQHRGRLLGVDPNPTTARSGALGRERGPLDDTFRGTGPFSDRRRNIRELQATRSITNLITNHTSRTWCCARRVSWTPALRWRSR